MPSISVYELLDEAQRRPPLLARERALPILVFTGDAKSAEEAVETAKRFRRRAPYAEINTHEADISTIVGKLVGNNGSLTPWVKGTLLPPPRFPLTRFVLWAWNERATAANEPKDPVGVRTTLRRSLSERRKKDAFTGPALRVMADYLSRTMTTWLPATGLATFGLQKLVDGVSLVLWLASPIVAVVGALLHALLLIRGWLFYRWFRKAPYVRRRRGEDLIAYAISVGRADQDEVERLMVTALLEDLRQAYQRRLIPWPGWGRNAYPLIALQDAEPGTTGRRFMELVEEVRARDGQRGPLLLVASTSQPPAGHRFQPPGRDYPFRDDASLGAAIRDGCESGAKVVYYTGRADFLSSLVRAWGASCEQRGVKLLASDDITGAIAKNVRSNPAGHDMSMSFVSLTDVRDPALENQSQRTLRQWAEKSGATVSFAHAAFGYDAAQAVGIAFDTYRTQSDADDIPSGVHYNLRGQAFDGATGTVSFSADATDHDAQNREVWLMTVESRRPIQANYVCRPTLKEAHCDPPTIP
ncbi:hypothetical protein AB0J42_13200 [Nonomuraea sp. NPDC049649]|uniref:hypothetical protein n=1 Tax=Nonomuraea sp. NPDC049649 TaxID=3155776 RepID=UPI003418D3C9